jgi:hypothetical protein
MSTLVHDQANGSNRASSSPWLLRLGVFVLVASGLSIVGLLAINQTSRKPVSTTQRIVSATIQASPDHSGVSPSVDAWRAEILSPTNLHATIADLNLDQGLLPRSEKTSSPAEWEAKVQQLLRVEAVNDRRHADDLIRIAFPVGRNAGEAVALVNGLAQRAVASRETTARQIAEQANESLLAKRRSTISAAERLQQLQSEFAGFKKSSTAQELTDKNSVSVDAFFAERRARLSSDLAEYQRRREVLLETVLPAHPEIRDLDLKIENVQAALAQVPPAKNPTDDMPLPPGANSASPAVDSKLLSAITLAWTDWQRLTADQAAAEQLWRSSGELPSFVVTLAQQPVIQLSVADKPSTAMLSFVMLAAMAVGVAAAGWIRSEPIVLRSARQIEKTLHLKVLAVLPSSGVKI